MMTSAIARPRVNCTSSIDSRIDFDRSFRIAAETDGGNCA